DMTPPKTLGKSKDASGRMRESSSHAFIPIAEVSLGKAALDYYGPWNEAAVNGPDEERGRNDGSPLAMAGWQQSIGPTGLMHSCADGLYGIESRGTVLEKEVPLLHVIFRAKKPAHEFEFFLDPNRGYLPARSVARTFAPPGDKRNPDIQTYLLDAKD